MLLGTGIMRMIGTDKGEGRSVLVTRLDDPNTKRAGRFLPARVRYQRVDTNNLTRLKTREHTAEWAAKRGRDQGVDCQGKLLWP